MRHKPVRHPCTIPVCRRHVGSNDRSQPGADNVWRRQQQAVPPIPRLRKRTHVSAGKTRAPGQGMQTDLQTRTMPSVHSHTTRSKLPKTMMDATTRSRSETQILASVSSVPVVRRSGQPLGRGFCATSVHDMHARTHTHTRTHRVIPNTEARQYNVRDRARGWEGTGRARVGGACTHLQGQQKQQFATRPRRRRSHQNSGRRSKRHLRTHSALWRHPASLTCR